jgi:3-oxoacyl-ACP reductase-like protein
MAKRTLADPTYADWDTAMSINRQILSCKSNHEDIYHVREHDGASANSTKLTSTTSPVPDNKPSPPPRPDDHPVTAPPAVQVMGQQENVLAAEILPDEPITARQILIFLVAYKLKKQLSDLPGSSTIKSLVQGKCRFSYNTRGAATI